VARRNGNNPTSYSLAQLYQDGSLSAVIASEVLVPA